MSGLEKTSAEEMGYKSCGGDHNDRSKMRAIFKGDALVDWVCPDCLKINGKVEVFEEWLKRMGFQ